MMTRSRLLRSVIPIAAALAVLVALKPAPGRARVVESSTTVSGDEMLSFDLSSTDGCVKSHLFGSVGRTVIRPGNQASTGGGVFYIREDECTDEYLAGVNESFELDPGAFSIHGDLESGTVQFTTSALEQVSQELVVVSVDITVAANGDKVHNHTQDKFGIPGVVAVIAEGSEWFRPAVTSGTFSVGGVGGSTPGDGGMLRGKATVTLKNYGPPFPHSN